MNGGSSIPSGTLSHFTSSPLFVFFFILFVFSVPAMPRAGMSQGMPPPPSIQGGMDRKRPPPPDLRVQAAQQMKA